MFNGMGVSSGIGIGTALIVKEEEISFEEKVVNNIEGELLRYKNAVEKFVDKTEKKAKKIKKSIGEKESEILLGHILMLNDPFMNGEIENLIKNNNCAEKAVTTVCDMFIMAFSSAEDDLTKQRATDVKDIRDDILRILLGIVEVDISNVPENSVLIIHELTPSMTASIDKNNIVAIVTETGSTTSHSAILARALEIPAVLSVANITNTVKQNEPIIVNGNSGEVILKPTIKEINKYKIQRNDFIKEQKSLQEYVGKPTQTLDGHSIELAANIGNVNDIQKAIENNAQSIGLFRTEFLFMDRATIPNEDEQFNAYKQVALALNGAAVIIRTLDIGGDKEVSYLGLEKEENPFLGYRAIRFCLHEKELFAVQLRAILRASAFGKIKIMIPLVTCVEELRLVKALIEDIKVDLRNEKIDFDNNIQVGVMMETAASVLIADILAEEADFFSIGTNDLTQYVMSVDRGNKKVSYLYSHYNPSVIRAVKQIITSAKQANIFVGMCGESAADPLYIPLLLGFGLDEFSVSSSSLLMTKKIISKWNIEDAKKTADEVLTLKTEDEIKKFLTKKQKK